MKRSLVRLALVFLFVGGTASLFAEGQSITWRYGTGGQIRSRPAVASDGTIYSLSEDGFLYALSAEGELLWKHDLGWIVADSLSVSPDGSIYAALKNMQLVAVNRIGSEIWRTQLDGQASGDSLVAPDGTVYAGTKMGTLYAFAPTGGLRWTISLPGAIASRLVMDGSGTLYIVATDRRLYALTQWGAFRWSIPFASQPSAPAIGPDGLLFVATGSGLLECVSPSGEVTWKAQVDSDLFTPVVSDVAVYVASAGGGIYSYAFDGKQAWHSQIGTHLFDCCILGQGEIYAVTTDGNLVATSMNGALDWTLAIGSPGTMSGVPGGKVYVGGKDWLIDAIQAVTSSARVEDLPWPEEGHDAAHSGVSPASTVRPDLLLENADYLYLSNLASVGSRDILRRLLLEISARVENGGLGKAGWYVANVLEPIVGVGITNPVISDKKVINDFPDVRALAARLLGAIGTGNSRLALIQILGSEYDERAIEAEIRALGRISSDPDGSSVRAISLAFRRRGLFPPDERIAAAVTAAFSSISRYEGSLPDESGYITLQSIALGEYSDSVRSSAFAAMRTAAN